MNSRRIRFFFMMALLAMSCVHVCAQPVYDCRRTGKAPLMDGRLNDRVWQKAAVIDNLIDICGGETAKPRQATSIRMLYDDSCLYIGAEMEEDFLRASVTRRDGIVWHDNDFEVFLDPYGEGVMYYELEFNVLGTLLDLLMDRPYCEGGTFRSAWDCRDLRYAVHYDGTVNDSADKDRGWSVEMAIPFASLMKGGESPLDSKVWRMNFSRVEWPSAQGREENWVWAPTGVVDIHRPSKWGYVRFVDGDVIPVVNPGKVVKNWMWEGLHKDWSDERYAKHFRKAFECGISAVLFEGYDERIYRLCHEAGLQCHYWNWTLNRHELVKTHPEWYAVSRTGKSCADEPPYVDYYHFLCPSRHEVVEYLTGDFVQKSELPYVDGMHLDYVRFPDIVLPVDLWKNYGLVQTSEAPEFDFCYCDSCRHRYEQRYGADPLKLEYPMASPSWISFRYDAVISLVKAIRESMSARHVFLSAAVFPTPDMARKMVRQDWSNWEIDAYFPMIYNGFYREGTAWIGQAVRECVGAVRHKSEIFAGLMFPDIKGDSFEKALDEAYGNGASGISFFDGPDDAHLERLKEYMDKHHLVPDRR